MRFMIVALLALSLLQTAACDTTFTDNPDDFLIMFSPPVFSGGSEPSPTPVVAAENQTAAVPSGGAGQWNWDLVLLVLVVAFITYKLVNRG